MIHSMTGFASAQTQIGARLLRLELRSVNGRFLDLYFRLPEDWRSFEPLLRERLQKALARGKIECRLEVQSAPVQAALTLDAVALQALSEVGIFLKVVPLQALLSIGLQWTLAHRLGLNGILLGLILSFVLTVVWILPMTLRRRIRSSSAHHLPPTQAQTA